MLNLHIYSRDVTVHKYDGSVRTTKHSTQQKLCMQTCKLHICSFQINF